jgi:hypothetical protein
MQLIQDTFIVEQLQVLNESNSNGPMRIRGVFGRCNEKNNNGRIYPTNILEGQLQKVQPLIEERRLCGELDHPQNDTVKLSNASHLITKLELKGNELIGEAELLKTPAGLTAQALINGGVKIGISSRGMGTLSEDREGNKIVNEDFRLVTFDLVADPSTRGAFPGLSESTESKFVRETQSKLEKEANFLTILEARLSGKELDEEIDLGGGSVGGGSGSSRSGKIDYDKEIKAAIERRKAADAERQARGTAGPGAIAGFRQGLGAKYLARGAAKGRGEGEAAAVSAKARGRVNDKIYADLKQGIHRATLPSKVNTAQTHQQNMDTVRNKISGTRRDANLAVGRGIKSTAGALAGIPKRIKALPGGMRKAVDATKRGFEWASRFGSKRTGKVNAGTEYHRIGYMLAEAFGLVSEKFDADHDARRTARKIAASNKRVERNEKSYNKKGRAPKDATARLDPEGNRLPGKRHIK